MWAKSVNDGTFLNWLDEVVVTRHDMQHMVFFTHPYPRLVQLQSAGTQHPHRVAPNWAVVCPATGAGESVLVMAAGNTAMSVLATWLGVFMERHYHPIVQAMPAPGGIAVNPWHAYQRPSAGSRPDTEMLSPKVFAELYYYWRRGPEVATDASLSEEQRQTLVRTMADPSGVSVDTLHWASVDYVTDSTEFIDRVWNYVCGKRQLTA
jgi:hypothetical protein